MVVGMRLAIADGLKGSVREEPITQFCRLECLKMFLCEECSSRGGRG